MRKIHYCIDKCGKKVSKKDTRCHSCENKRRHKAGILNSIGKNNCRYVDGKTMIQYYCLDCHKEITRGSVSGRCLSCAKKEFFKNPENNPFYEKKHTKETKSKLSLSHGGSGIPYENSEYNESFNEKLRNEIRERDSYICQNSDCFMTQEEHFIRYGKDLEVHHIDYDKKNSNENNLITLCRPCHVRTNFNRDYWEKCFRESKLMPNALLRQVEELVLGNRE